MPPTSIPWIAILYLGITQIGPPLYVAIAYRLRGPQATTAYRNYALGDAGGMERRPLSERDEGGCGPEPGG